MGNIYGYVEGGSTNARDIGNDQAIDNLIDLLERCAAFGRVAVSRLRACLITSAAVATREQADLMSAGVLRGLRGDVRVSTVPDTMGCWAITAELAPAVTVISGTGSVVFCGDISAGVCRSYGNWDFLLGDHGSGFAIGRAALQEAMRFGEGRSDASAIAHICLNHYEIDDLQAIPDAVHKPAISKTDIAAIARPILDAAADGHTAAIDIVARQARLLAATTLAALAQMADPTPVVGCFGGVFRNPVFFAEFSASLRRDAPLVDVRVAPGSPLAGAFRLLKNSSDRPGSPGYVAAVRRFDAQLSRFEGRG